MKHVVARDRWHTLRRFTAARIGLGRSGASLPTREVLAFGLAHAQARDAVHVPLDVAALRAALQAEELDSLCVHSAACDRADYLRRPDHGRTLDLDSHGRLAAAGGTPSDAVLVLADGLSAHATQSHAVALIRGLRPRLAGWRLAPVIIAEQARVALGDEIATLLGARQVVMLIGERPGLSSPDSLGIYLTHEPRQGLTDADRNCISNVRPDGLDPAAAASKLAYLMNAARSLGRSGIALKDQQSLATIEASQRPDKGIG